MHLSVNGARLYVDIEGAGTVPDGAALEIPRGVTLMVDAGAVFKLRQSRISAGSSAARFVS